MFTECKKCSSATATIEELIRIYESNDAPKMMSILTETIATDENLHPRDRKVLAQIMHLITSLVADKITYQQNQIDALKKSA